MSAGAIHRWLGVLLAGLLIVGVVAASPASAADGPILSVGDQSGLERDSVTGSVFLPIYLSAPVSEPVVVSFWTVDGTATAGADYLRWGTPAAPRTVTIPPGETQTQVNVPVLADDDVEADETFSLTATAAGGGVVVGDDTGTATIVDADAVSELNPAITVSDTTVVEGDLGERRAQFLIHLSRVPTSNVTITYATSDGAAVAGADYTPKLPGTVVFAPGQISKTIDVVVLANDTVDGTRDFSLNVAVTGGSPVEEISTTGRAVVVDDEVADTTAPVLTLPDDIGATADAPTGVEVEFAASAVDEVDGEVPVTCTPPSGSRFPLGETAVTCRATDSAGNEATGSFFVEVSPLTAPLVVEVSAGSDHSCALLSDGTVRCWGRNNNGQLGDGSTNDSAVAVEVVGLSSAVAVAAGRNHSCAVLQDGTARCWGSRSFGQLGDGRTGGSSSVPVVVMGLTGVASIAAGEYHNCVVLADGGARCWGRDSFGQLGQGTYASSNRPVVVTGLSGATEISAGTDHTCAVSNDGSARCWGSNASNKLGIAPTTQPSNTPILVSGLSNVVTISAAFDHSCASLADGTARCWGNNAFGKLGNGNNVNSSVPVVVSGLTGLVRITASRTHTCGQLSDGSLSCWGSNTYGQLGDGTTTSTTQPVAALLPGVSSYASTYTHSCAALDDGTARCWGQNYSGQLGNGAFGFDQTVPVTPDGVADAVAIATGGIHTCALRTDGTAQCWGYNGFGQVGDGTDTNARTPAWVAGLTGATAISTGANTSCAVLEDTTARCWGSNGFGQLGDGTQTSSNTPVVVVGLTDVVAMAPGHLSSCAVLGNGTVWCWGSNSSGQLGDGTNSNSNTPVAVAGLSSANAISGGSTTACALLDDTSVRCWGDNSNGQLGNGTTANSNVPVTVSGLSGVTAVSLDGNHGCALLADTTVRCWGQNQYGQLGNGSTSGSPVPVAVSGLTGVVGISTGTYHSCALLADGTVQCWGYNGNGQLGSATGTAGSLVPVDVPGAAGAVDISVATHHSCIVVSDGSARCWGSNAFGRLGDGAAFSALPEPVEGLP